MTNRMDKLTKEKEALFSSVLDKKRPYLSDGGIDESLLDEVQKNLQKDYGVKTKPDLNEIFHDALPVLKRSVLGEDDAMNALVNAFHRPYVMGTEKDRPASVIIINGPRGSGRHTALKKMAEYLYQSGAFSSDKIETVDLSRYASAAEEKIFIQDLYKAVHQSTKIVCFENAAMCNPVFIRMLEQLAAEGSLPLKKRYVLNNGILIENQTGLVNNTVDCLKADDLYLIFMQNEGQRSYKDLFTAGFLKHVNDIVEFKPLDEQSVHTVVHQKCSELIERCVQQLHIEMYIPADTEKWICCHCDKQDGMHGVDHLLNVFYTRISDIYMHDQDEQKRYKAVIKEDMPYVDTGKTCIAIFSETKQNSLVEINKELDQIIGLDNVKEYIHSLQALVDVNKRRNEQGLPAVQITRHMIFTGNPGTGKTTVARLIARYMKAAGVLSEGQLIEVTRSDLVARYVGQTAPQTLRVIQSAVGGVLFIDEAYSLYRGKDDSFGLEAIDTIVKAMEDYRDNLIVILAGYKKEMQVFLEANSGLESRFPVQIEFPDYKADELLAIAEQQAQKKGYEIDEKAFEPLKKYFTYIQDKEADKAGNGRLARNVVEKAVLSQSRRIMQDPSADLILLKPEDFSFNNTERNEQNESE